MFLGLFLGSTAGGRLGCSAVVIFGVSLHPYEIGGGLNEKLELVLRLYSVVLGKSDNQS